MRLMTEPTAISSLRAGSRTTVLRARSLRSGCRGGSASPAGVWEPPNPPSPAEGAQTTESAPGPVIGIWASWSARSGRGGLDRGIGSNSDAHSASDNAISCLRSDLALGVKRGTFQEDAREVVCVSFRHTHCKGTSKNTKDNVLERVQQGRMSGKGSVTRSVRIEKDADQRLRNLASQGDTSVNTLVNRALRKFVEWDAYGEKFGFITLPSAMLVKLMDCLSDEEARELGVWAGKNLVKEYITFWFKEVTPETLLEGFPKLLAKYGRAFAFEELEEGVRRTIILKHRSGAEWSTFYEEAIRTSLRENLGPDFKVEKSENQVVVRLRLYE